jgi:AraC-like DNA-binding protein
VFEDLSNTCGAVAAQMREAAICARQGNASAADELIGSAIDVLLNAHSEAGRKAAGAAHVDSGMLSRGALSPWRARRVIEHIELRLGEAIEVQELAGLVGLSYSHFCRAFKERFGVTAHGYVTGRRMQMAQHYLLTTPHRVAEVALRCGMADQAHLTRTFHRVFGAPPARWRRARLQMPAERIPRSAQQATPSDTSHSERTASGRALTLAFHLEQQVKSYEQSNRRWGPHARS